jgi:hypothetical protein
MTLIPLWKQTRRQRILEHVRESLGQARYPPFLTRKISDVCCQVVGGRMRKPSRVVIHSVVSRVVNWLDDSQVAMSLLVSLVSAVRQRE